MSPALKSGAYRKMARPSTCDNATGPNVRLSVLSSGRSPRTMQPPLWPGAPRFRTSRSGTRGSRARTISPTRGGRARGATTTQSPSRRAGSMLRPATATLRNNVLGPGCGRLWHPRGGRPAGLGPHVVDLVDHVEEHLGFPDVERPLHLGALFRGLPAELGDFWVFLDVLRLEVIAPEDIDVVLGQFRALFLDYDRPGLELLVARGVVLLDDLVARLRFNARLLGVVDAARQVAMGVRDGLRLQQIRKEHETPPSCGCLSVVSRLRGSHPRG